MSADPAAVEALGQAWAACVTGGDDPFPTPSERKGAVAFLASEWLAARDAAMRAEGAAAVLRDLADGLTERNRGDELRAALDRTEGDT